MPSIRSYNQSAPFWDWVASMEDQQGSHPWFDNVGAGTEEHHGPGPFHPREAFARGWGRNFPWGANLPHRGGPGGWGRHRPGPPPPPGAEEDPAGPPPPDYDRTPHASGDEMEVNDEKAEGDLQPATDPEEGNARGDKAAARAARREAREAWREARRCGMKGRGGMAARGGFGHGGRGHGGSHGFGCHGHGEHDAGEFGAGARHGRHGHHGRPPFPFPMGGLGGLAETLQNQIFGVDANKRDGIFKPEVDVFDTAESFVVHVSLPGAKKEDVGVHWDAEKSELAIAGVIYRPGDEEFLKTLAMDERKVGEFERNVRLGSRANPAHVDADGITARMEDGILRVEIPKLDSGYVDIKRVDIE